MHAELGASLSNRQVLNASSLKAVADDVYSAITGGLRTIDDPRGSGTVTIGGDIVLAGALSGPETAVLAGLERGRGGSAT